MRGLPGHAGDLRAEFRIIPARAGFTVHRGVEGGHHLDHPRSRGVYRPASTNSSSASGSSPLARGLHFATDLDNDTPRIIPARAGFTRRGRGARRARADHPRSRGVYWRRTPASSTSSGSSPLARGLLLPAHADGALQGIIPARAGFTVRDVRGAGDRRDHPRSRGVYPVATGSRRTGGGSSPLARGLLEGLQAVGGVPGIIPARAGFTEANTTSAAIGTDHPRSRGVYGCRLPRQGFRTGSSPLARGLPPSGAVGCPHRGIIPARAGFTRRPRGRCGRRRDHPRSRGVYDEPGGCRHRDGGSSPLARGLHLRILGIPTNPYSTRPLLPSLPT